MATMYDAVDWWQIPRDAAYIAAYSNGEFAADFAALAKTYPKAWVFHIDVLGTDPDAGIKDIETGDITVGSVRSVVMERADKHPGFLIRLYCNLSTWPGVKAEVAGLSNEVQRNIRYWIANPFTPAHIVPGSSATQYNWGRTYDTSEILTRFIQP
jgi:hypothetical protein